MAKPAAINTADLEKKRRSDSRKRPERIGEAPLIEFLEFSQLKGIIVHEWQRFEDALGNQEAFELDMTRLHGFRNPKMHSRELLVYEEDLVNGITGRMRAQIAKYRSEQGPDMNYYPTIDRIIDATFAETLTDGLKSSVTLRPGDKVTFRCSATDPNGRPFRWELRVSKAAGQQPTVDEADGNDVELTWEVQDEHVKDGNSASIKLIGSGNYHRNGFYDDSFHIYYDVHPPKH
ncbi:hypothetical protein ACTHQY_04565 [Rhodococcoides corynebacterioides]|uniref:hypothetical protein n=1 Tax=Rhodococcoides corynebacterioides TaxID=53972 RepID=UPI003F7E50F6